MAFTPQNIASAVSLDGVSLSPDGNKVVYCVIEPKVGGWAGPVDHQLSLTSNWSQVVNSKSRHYGTPLICSKRIKWSHPKSHLDNSMIVNHNGPKTQNRFISSVIESKIQVVVQYKYINVLSRVLANLVYYILPSKKRNKQWVALLLLHSIPQSFL